MKLIRTYLAGFLKTLLATAGTQAGTYFTLIALSRILGLERFGSFSAVQSTLTAAFGLSTLGIGVTATRYISRYRGTDPARAGRILGLCLAAAACSGLTFSAAILWGSDRIAADMFHAPGLAPALRWTAICCPILTWNAVLSGTLVGYQAFGRLLRAQSVQAAATLGISSCLASIYSLDGAILALPLSAFVGLFCLAWESLAESEKHGIGLTIRGSFEERFVLYEFALPAAASGMVGSAAVWVAQMILASTNAGLNEVGLWTAAMSIRGAVLLAPAVLARVSTPILSSIHDHGNVQTYRKTLWGTSVVSALGALLAGLAVWFSSPLLLRLFGRDFDRASSVLPAIIASAIVEAYACGMSQALVAHGKLHFQLAIICAWAICLVGLAWMLVPQHGGHGLALAYLIAWITTAAGYSWSAYWLSGQPRQTPQSSQSTFSLLGVK